MGMIDRVEQGRRRYGLRQVDIANLLGMSSGILGTWKSRGNSEESLSHVSDTFLWSRDWLMGNSEIMWRQDVIVAQEKLRSWARRNDCQTMSIGERFVAVWEQFSSVVPMREDIWATHLYMLDCEVYDKPDDDTPPHHDWLDCKLGKYEPGVLQIRYASELTGLPERWFRTGDPQYVGKLTDAERERLERFIRENALEVEDVMAACNALITK